MNDTGRGGDHTGGEILMGRDSSVGDDNTGGGGEELCKE